MVYYNNEEPDELDNWMIIKNVLSTINAEQYLPTFRKLRLTGEDLILLDDEQLKMMGVVELALRKDLIDCFSKLPSKHIIQRVEKIPSKECLQMMKNTSQHLNYLTNSIRQESKLADTIQKHHNALIKEDLLASMVFLKTCDGIITELEEFKQVSDSFRRKRVKKHQKWKIVLFGSAAIAVISFYFVKSLKNMD